MTDNKIVLDYTRDALFDELGLKRLKESYMTEEETSPQERFAFVSQQFGSNPEHAQRLYDYASKHWLSYSTPILSFAAKKRQLPISCFTGETLVTTNTGKRPISELRIGDLVLSHNSTYNPITNTKSHMSDDLYILEFGDDVFHVTGNHLIMTREDGWVRVDELDADRHQVEHLFRMEHKKFSLKKSDKDNLYIMEYDNEISHVEGNGIVWTTEHRWVRVDELDADRHRIEPMYALENKNFSLKKSGKTEIVYDIEVANTHTFTVGRSAIIVHNCYLPWLADTAEGLVDTLSEVNWLSMLGGGVGIGVGIRSTDDKSVGIMPHLRTYDASCLAYRQGQTRRGSYATYLDISHPDILLFLEMRKPTGDPNMRCQNLHHGINITDAFMEIIERCMIDPEADDTWELKDPHSGVVRDTISAKELWQRILEMRMQTGEPYLHFIDTSNRHLPEFQKKLGLSIKQSNLCLAGETMIAVSFDPEDEGYVSERLDHFVEKWQSGHYSECYVCSMKDGEIVWSPVLNAGKTGDVEKVLHIRTASGNTLRCTHEHKIYTTTRGWVEAKDLRDTMDRLSNNERFTVWYESAPFTVGDDVAPSIPVYDLTVGDTESFFANGILVHNCSEIILPTDKDRTAVCCLSSVNLEYYDDWKKNHLFLSDVAEMLDNVLQQFIDNAPKAIHRAKYSAMRERSIGIGALGFHAYLQKKNIPWESAPATSLNKSIFKHIRARLDEANLRLGEDRGEAPDAKGTGRRFCHMTAIAPNASSSIIMGNTSPSVEPFRANAYRQDTISGTYLNKNRYLDMLIKKLCKDNSKLDYDEVWSSIIANDGSVQHLDMIDDYTKHVFKTAMEIDQRWVIQHASERQEFIDQAQSINVFFRPDVNIKYLHAVHFQGWKTGLKTLYYCRSEKLAKADKVAKRIEREVIQAIDLKALAAGEETCLACE